MLIGWRVRILNYYLLEYIMNLDITSYMAILIIFLPILLFVLLLVSLINSQRRQAKAQETMASAQADIAKYLAKRDT